MERIIPLATIEIRNPLSLVITPYNGIVWRVAYYLPAYQKNLPFMADADPGYPPTSQFGSLLVNHLEYRRVDSMEILNMTQGCYCVLNNNELYLHFINESYPMRNSQLGFGFMMGISSDAPAREAATEFEPRLLSLGDIEQSSDPINYTRMQFNSFSVSIDNSDGKFDNLTDIFGNSFNINLIVFDAGKNIKNIWNIYQGYIANQTTTLNNIILSIKDKRELLSMMLPIKTYNSADFPFLDPKYNNKVIQEAYGHCFEILGTCIDSNRIVGNPDISRTFKFATKITRLDLLEVYIDKTWTALTDPSKYTVDYYNGTVTLPIALAHDKGDKANSINEVRATGIFRNACYPLDIILDLIDQADSYTYSRENFNISELTSELSELGEIHLVMDEKKEFYSWLEIIQNGSTQGFQVINDFDRFTVRLDNPNRVISHHISKEEIVDLSAVEVDWDADNYASIMEINYGYYYESKLYRTIIDSRYRLDILDIHKLEKYYKNDSLLVNETDAIYKGHFMSEIYHKLRPVLKNINLFGSAYFGIKLYDIIELDLSYKGINRMERKPIRIVRPINENTNDIKNITQMSGRYKINEIITHNPPFARITNIRNFMGTFRGQVIRRVISTGGMVTIDVRQRDTINI
jgi:hypothetical protein